MEDLTISDFMSIYQAIDYLQSIRMSWYDETTGKFTNPEADKIYHLIMNLTQTKYKIEALWNVGIIADDDKEYEKIENWNGR